MVFFIPFWGSFKECLFGICLESRLALGYVLKLGLFPFDVLFVHVVHLVEFFKPESEFLNFLGVVCFHLFDVFGMLSFKGVLNVLELALMLESGLL